jgi:hypothetical protein
MSRTHRGALPPGGERVEPTAAQIRTPPPLRDAC